jgi:hypothetical protein
MDSIEQHRRKIAASGIIDPDCLPPEYWTRYAAKRAIEKYQARATAACADRVAKAGDCPGCRLVTDPAALPATAGGVVAANPVSPTTPQEPTNGRTADPAPPADPDAPAAAPAPEQPAE